MHLPPYGSWTNLNLLYIELGDHGGICKRKFLWPSIARVPMCVDTGRHLCCVLLKPLLGLRACGLCVVTHNEVSNVCSGVGFSLPWRWRHYKPLKHWYPPSTLLCIITAKTTYRMSIGPWKSVTLPFITIVVFRVSTNTIYVTLKLSIPCISLQLQLQLRSSAPTGTWSRLGCSVYKWSHGAMAPHNLSTDSI
jgi:hypothetical protein